MKYILRRYADLVAILPQLKEQMDAQPDRVFILNLGVRKSTRSLDQNALSHAWYREIATITGDTPMDIRCECKLRYGVPILRAESEEFRADYDRVVKPHDYETKLKIMRWLPVTSLMNTPQMTAYLNDMALDYSRQGVILEAA